jgi:aminopeptidase YwaD
MQYSAILFFYILLHSLGVFAQNLGYAREVVNTLASENMKGRGYVQNGNSLAADYISNEFQKMGLKTFGKNYFQPFTTPVNTFPGAMQIRINSIELKPGIDFLIDAGSPDISGTFKTVQLKTDDLLRDDRLISKLKGATGKFLVLEAYDKKLFNKDENKKIDEAISFLQYSPSNPASGTIILTWNKLTWSGSTEQNSKPTIIIKVDSVYTAIENISLNIKSKFIKKFESKNVIGYIAGERADSFLVFTAHYDHLGMMGDKTIFPGANDNASGVALLLNLVKYYTANKPRYNIVIIAFGGEEIGLLGSKYFTEHPLFELKKIKFLLNFDLAGTGEEGIQIVNGSLHKTQFDLIYKMNKEQKLLADVKIRGEACNSDHCFFTQQKVPCFFIYTLGGIKAYHDVYDKPETLPLTEFEDYFKLIVAFVKEI